MNIIHKDLFSKMITFSKYLSKLYLFLWLEKSVLYKLLFKPSKIFSCNWKEENRALGTLANEFLLGEGTGALWWKSMGHQGAATGTQISAKLNSVQKGKANIVWTPQIHLRLILVPHYLLLKVFTDVFWTLCEQWLGFRDPNYGLFHSFIIFLYKLWHEILSWIKPYSFYFQFIKFLP